MNVPKDLNSICFERITRVYRNSQQKPSAQAFMVIYFAVKKGLGCRDTAEKIMADLETADNLNETTLSVVEELSQCSYFQPSPKISQLMNNYLSEHREEIIPDDEDIYGKHEEVFFETISSPY